jgi:hypothetical protein
MGNPFADAVKPVASEVKTHTVVDHPPFFQHAIEQDKLKRQAQNMTRQDMFNNGFLTVEDMDDEELRCGRMRDANGKIPRVNKTMEMIPRDLYDEMVAEHQRRTQEKFRQTLDDCLDAMATCVADDTAEWRDRNDAAKYIIERVMGKTPDKVQVAVTKAPWEELFTDVAHITRAQHNALKAGVIDAEVVEDSTPAQDGANLHPPGADHVPNAGVSDRPRYHDVQATSGDSADDGPGGGDGAGHWQLPDATAPFAPPTPAPSFVAPATSNPVHQVAQASTQQQVQPTVSQAIAHAQAEAQRVAEARANRKKVLQAAKSKRIAKRALGVDVQNRLLRDVPIDGVQSKLLGALDDTQDVDEP